MQAATREALLAALRLQLDFGVDEALEDAAPDRLRAVAAAPAAPARVQAATARAPTAAAAPAEAADLAALRAAIAATDSALRETATTLVFGDGAIGSGLMLIGDAPGAEEDRAGRAFAGPGGQLLDRMLASIGLDRASGCYLTNILPWRPPGNRAPTEAELALFLPFLLRHVALVRPRRLLLLGGVTTKALLHTREGISRARGRWHRLPTEAGELPALPTLHPDTLLRTPSAKREAWADLTLLRRTLDADITQS